MAAPRHPVGGPPVAVFAGMAQSWIALGNQLDRQGEHDPISTARPGAAAMGVRPPLTAKTGDGMSRAAPSVALKRRVGVDPMHRPVGQDSGSTGDRAEEGGLAVIADARASRYSTRNSWSL
jgi:hypothetical protein